MEFKVSIAPLAQIVRSVVMAIVDAIVEPMDRFSRAREAESVARERREDAKREVELNKVQANWDRAQKHNDDALDVFRQNRDLYERQALALEAIQESLEYIAKALAVMNERSVRLDPPSFGPQPDPVPKPEKKPMRKARP